MTSLWSLLATKNLDENKQYDHVLYSPGELPVDFKWHDDILIHEPSHDLVIRLLYLLRTSKMKDLDSITLVTKAKKSLKKFVKGRFLIIEAAGGVVSKKDKMLLIHRLGKWDFPKGKLDKGETPEECAKREVKEECNVRARLGPHVCNTWHTYTQHRKSILKKTYWFAMESIHDSDMKPQAEEGIDDILWMTEAEAKIALINSYPSMRYLFGQYLKRDHLKSHIL